MTTTYLTYRLHTIMPAVGWQAVQYDGERAVHTLMPVQALALASIEVRERRTHRLVSESPRQIVGMLYFADDGFTVAEEDRNHCGLLPPGMALDTFVAEHHGCQASAQAVRHE